MNGELTNDPKETLRVRARALARLPEDEADGEASLELLEFRLAQECYAVETRHVREVHPLKNLTPLPSVPPFISGIVNVRGRILPVLDLKKFFGLPDSGLTDLHRIILISGHGLELGLLADISVGVINIPAKTLKAGPSTLTGIGTEYVEGVTDRRLIVLAMDRILMDPRILVNETVDT